MIVELTAHTLAEFDRLTVVNDRIAELVCRDEYDSPELDALDRERSLLSAMFVGAMRAHIDRGRQVEAQTSAAVRTLSASPHYRPGTRPGRSAHRIGDDDVPF